MARATKCPKCRLTQMSTTGQCKKCGAPLDNRAGPTRRVDSSPPIAPPALDDNPYVPPRATALGDVGLGHQAESGLWRDGKILVASQGSEFPDRCVKCNQPTGNYRLRRKLYWHPSGWYALILINVLVYAVVAAIIRKTSDLRVGLCETHRKRRLLSIGLGLAIPLLGGVGCTMTVEDPSGTGIWVGMIGFITGVVILIVGTSVLSAEGIDERFARIRGAGPAFLASLPPFHR